MHGGEWSLIVFTLLTQAAVGIHFFSILLPGPDKSVPPDSIQGRIKWLGMHSLSLLLLFPALAAAFFHLGSPENAVYAISQLKTSWLSREIVAFLFFGAGSLVYFWIRIVIRGNRRLVLVVWSVTGIFGMILIFSMSAIYRLPAAPAWNSWLTPALFLFSALLLGGWMTLRNLTLGVSNPEADSEESASNGNSVRELKLKMLSGWMVCLAAAAHLLHYLFYQKIRTVFDTVPYQMPDPFAIAVTRTVFLLPAFLGFGGAWIQFQRNGRGREGAGFWINSAGIALIISEIIARFLFYSVYVRSNL